MQRIAVSAATLALLGLSQLVGCGDDGDSTEDSTTAGTSTAGTSSDTAPTSGGSSSGPTTGATGTTDPSTSSSATGPATSTDATASGSSTGDTAFNNTWSMAFDGVSGELTGGTVEDLLGATFDTVSVSLWTRTNAETPATQGILTLGEGTFTDTVFIFWSSEKAMDWIAFYGGGVNFRAPIADPSAWHHVVATYSATSDPELVLYIDGVEAGTATGTDLVHAAAGSPFIGRFGPSGIWLDGNIDELAIWGTELTAAEAAALYGDGAPTDLAMDTGDYASSADLVAWWRMGDDSDGSGTEVADEVGANPVSLAAGASFDSNVP